MFKRTLNLSNAICILIRHFYPNVAGWHRSSGSHEVITQRVSPVILKIMSANILVSWPRPVRVTWRFLSRDHLIPQVPFSMGALHRVSISNHFRDIWHFLYLGHDLDLSRSRDVIGHMTNRSAICHFLLVSHCNRTSISNRFRDIQPHTRANTHTYTHTRKHSVTFGYKVPPKM